MSAAADEALRFAPAGPDDDGGLRRLLRETPMDGSVRVAFAREPSFFAASEIEGPVHQVIAARAGARIVGMCSRSVRPMWVNGARRAVGYLSALRLEPRYRGRPRTLQQGFAAVRALHDTDGACPFYLTTIIEDNAVARRVLERGLPGFPRYRALGVLVTLAMPTWRARRILPPKGVALRPGTDADLPALRACLERNAGRHHFRPSWDEENLALCRDLRPADFVLAERGEALVGCVALWDQRGFKQNVVDGYNGLMGRFRGLINLLAPILGVPRLPPPGGTLDGLMLSHLAVDEDDEPVTLALLAAAHARAVGRVGTVTLGMPEHHELRISIERRFGAIPYRSVIYAAAWEDGHAAIDALDDRLAWPEVAVL